MCIYWVYLFVSIGQRVLMLNTHSIALVRIISRGCYARNNTIHKGVNIITANTILQRANVDTKATYELVIAWLSVGHIYFPEGPVLQIAVQCSCPVNITGSSFGFSGTCTI